MPFGGTPTQNFGLGQYVGTDMTSWNDNSQTNAKLDTILFGIQTSANTAVENSVNANNTANAANGKADTAIADAATAKTMADTANTNAALAKTTADSATTTANNAFDNVEALKNWNSVEIKPGLFIEWNRDIGMISIYGVVNQGSGMNIATLPINAPKPVSLVRSYNTVAVQLTSSVTGGGLDIYPTGQINVSVYAGGTPSTFLIDSTFHATPDNWIYP